MNLERMTRIRVGTSLEFGGGYWNWYQKLRTSPIPVDALLMVMAFLAAESTDKITPGAKLNTALCGYNYPWAVGRLRIFANANGPNVTVHDTMSDVDSQYS